MDELTLLVPTKNKSIFLRKSLTYYAAQGLRYPILIDDASEGDEVERNQALIDELSGRLTLRYRVRPGRGHLLAYGELLERVESPYVVLGGDDDFFIPHQLDACVEFLDRHPGFQAAWGTVVRVWGTLRADGSYVLRRTDELLTKDILAERAAQRVLEFTSPAILFSTHAVRRTEPLRAVWRACMTRFLNVNEWSSQPFFEVAQTTATIIAGKQRKLPGLFHVWVRNRRPTPPGYVTYDSYERLTKLTWEEHLPALTDLLTQALVEQEGLDPREAERCAQAAWTGYLLPWLTLYRQEVFQELGAKAPGDLRRLFGRLSREGLSGLPAGLRARWRRWWVSLDVLRHPVSPYHRDFLPIQQVLEAPRSGREAGSRELQHKFS